MHCCLASLRRVRRCCAAILCALPCVALGAAEAPALDQLLKRLVGDFNNHEQVWQQELDKVAPSPHLHTRIHRPPFASPSRISATPPALVRVEEFAGQFGGELLRERLLVFQWKGAELRAETYLPRDPRAPPREALYWPQGWRHLQGCALRWEIRGPRFEARLVEPSACQSAAAQQQAWAPASLAMSLGEREADFYYRRAAASDAASNEELNEEQYHNKSRRVRWFRGWIAIRKSHLDGASTASSAATAPADDEWLFHCGQRTHNEGWRFPMMRKGGEHSGYEVQLARLTQQQAQLAVLVLKLFRRGEEKAFSYTWADIDAKRLGINLRWIQTGWTAEPGRNSC